MLLSDEQYRNVWDRVYDTLHFCPSVDTSVMPFIITAPHTVFDISRSDIISFEQFDHLITKTFIFEFLFFNNNNIFRLPLGASEIRLTANEGEDEIPSAKVTIYPQYKVV